MLCCDPGKDSIGRLHLARPRSLDPCRNALHLPCVGFQILLDGRVDDVIARTVYRTRQSVDFRYLGRADGDGSGYGALRHGVLQWLDLISENIEDDRIHDASQEIFAVAVEKMNAIDDMLDELYRELSDLDRKLEQLERI